MTTLPEQKIRDLLVEAIKEDRSITYLTKEEVADKVAKIFEQILAHQTHPVDLHERNNTRFRCRATVERFGFKPGWGGGQQTILLRDITDAAGEHLFDRQWLATGTWSNLTIKVPGGHELGIMKSLEVGDVFEFDARVYSTGLERLNKVTLISKRKPGQEAEAVS